MNLNVAQMLQDALDATFAGLQGQINSLSAQVEELKKLETANYDLQKQLQVKSAENDMLRERIAQLEDQPGQPQERELPALSLMWPKTAETGPAADTKLADYTGPDIIRTKGYVVDGKMITRTITVEADGVIFRNCLFKLKGNYAIWQNDGFNSLTIENCEIDGRGSSKMAAIAVQKGGIVRRCNIYGMVIGIMLWDNDCKIEENYIHDLAEKSTKADDRHFDGIHNLGASNCVIRRNAIVMPAEEGGTAAIFLSAQNAPIRNVQVLDNLCIGQPSYSISVEKSRQGMSGVVLARNYIEKGIFGHINNDGGAEETDNVLWDDAVQVAPAAVQAWRAAA